VTISFCWDVGVGGDELAIVANESAFVALVSEGNCRNDAATGENLI
jgi:hypothetical protein